MVLLFTIIFFVLGLIIGSFLNVVILRFGTNKSLGGRSSCMSCQNQLCWYELIPLFSFLALRGRCMHCKTKISAQYPLVEFVTGVIFALLFLKFQNFLFVNPSVFATDYLYYAIAFSILTVIAVYDLKHKIIPDTLSIFLGVLTFVGLFLFNNYSFFPHIPTILQFLSGVFIAFPFFFLWLVSRGAWMGLGDAKLALSIGWLLGNAAALSALVFAFWSGAIVGLYLIIFAKSHGMKSEIPFAPYLVLGALAAFLFSLCFLAPFCS